MQPGRQDIGIGVLHGMTPSLSPLRGSDRLGYAYPRLEPQQVARAQYVENATCTLILQGYLNPSFSVDGVRRSC